MTAGPAASLAGKLGVRAGMGCVPLGPVPEGLDLAPITAAPAQQAPPRLILAFAPDQAALAAVAPAAIGLCRPGARLWFAYPRRTGTIRSDLHRDAGWGPVEAAGLLGVAQVALDATWSALRFRRREAIPKLTRRGA